MYKKRILSVFVFCTIFVSVFRMAASFAKEIVYDNTSTSLGYYSPANVEYGDQITLGGTNRLIDDFKFAYRIASFANVINGNETAQDSILRQ